MRRRSTCFAKRLAIWQPGCRWLDHHAVKVTERLNSRRLRMTPLIREKFKNSKRGLKRLNAGMLLCRLGWMSCNRETEQMVFGIRLPKFKDSNRYSKGSIFVFFFLCNVLVLRASIFNSRWILTSSSNHKNQIQSGVWKSTNYNWNELALALGKIPFDLGLFFFDAYSYTPKEFLLFETSTPRRPNCSE